MANLYGLSLASALTSLTASTVCVSSAYAQSAVAGVVPSEDGIGTVVTRSGDQFTIEQGTLSSDRTNQFHSFESFSLNATESANFIAPTSVQNIVAKVNGAAPSVIDGTLQVTDSGSDPNLYLMNSSGILFGPNASLNLPGSFTATTAEEIGFEQGWFGSGIEDIDTIAGLPTGDFVLTSSKSSTEFHSDVEIAGTAIPRTAISGTAVPGTAVPGTISNEGNLAVRAGENISLLGSSVTNAGTLSAPSGNITLAAAPSDTLIKLRQPNGLITLEFEPLDSSNHASITDLPALLTGGERRSTELSIAEDGTAALSRSSPTAGTLSVSGSLSATGILPEHSGGNISLAGRDVALNNATLAATGANGGGTIRIGGDYKGQSTLPSAQTTVVDAETTLLASAISRGNGGRVIVWANDTTQYLGVAEARGGEAAGNGGFVEISGKRTLFFDGVVDTHARNGEAGSLLLDPENINIINGRTALDDEQVLDGQVLRPDVSSNNGEGLLTISEGTLASLSGDTNITLEASNNITVSPLNDGVLAFAPGTGTVTFRADADADGNGDIVMSDPTTTLIAPNRDVSLSGANLRLGDINTVSTRRSLQSGNVTLQATGSTTVGNIDTFSYLVGGRSGDVSITSADIISQNISTLSPSIAGDVTLTGLTGSISTGAISSAADNGRDGTTTFIAPNSITVDGTVVQAPPTAETIPPLAEPESVPEQPPEPAISNSPTRLEANKLQALNALQAVGPSASEVSSSAATSTEESALVASRSVTLSSTEANAAIAQTESTKTQAFSDYFGRKLTLGQSDLEDIQQQLSNTFQQSGSRTAIVYIEATEETPEANSDPYADEPTLEMMIVTADSPAISVTVPNIERAELTKTVTAFRNRLITSARRGNTSYLADAQQLYQWLIGPIEKVLEAELKDANIDTLAFAMGDGLRALPIAALHDGERFLIEKYAVGMLPSVGLTQLEYAPLNNARVMAMGVSKFEQKEPLPGVDLEIKTIGETWPGSTFLNEQFTQAALRQQQAQRPAQIVHLATHANFRTGNISDSYIQLWDEKLSLDKLAALGWDSPIVDLLVLSACSTALGSDTAELGFAGVAVASGVRSAIATLWPVDDLGTLALMDELYERLDASPTKALSLQAAQLALLEGRSALGQQSALGAELSDALSQKDLSHPYYWSAFTLIGSPW